MKKTITTLFCMFSIYWLFGQSDTYATSETKSLYCYLKSVKGQGLIFGQQFSTLLGQNFIDTTCALNTSDCLMSYGSHPAMLGLNYTFDTVILKKHILNFRAQGGIITLHWPMDNPVTGNSVSDTTPAVYSLLVGGSKHQFYRNELKKLGNFCKNLYDNNQKPIPVIFRPFHENSSSWSWWGNRFCTAQEYIELYQYTVSFLRDTLGVHNLLYAYAPSAPSRYSVQYPYISRYPGDNFIDIIGFDRYGNGSPNFATAMVEDCKIVVQFAQQRNKVAAITEAGIGGGVQNTQFTNFFMSNFLRPILKDTIARNIAYWMTWSNISSNTYWIPLPSQPTYQSFDSLYNDSYTLFLNDLPGSVYNCNVLSVSSYNDLNSGLTIYPNPVNNTLFVKSFREISHIEIYNSNGQIMTPPKNTEIDCSHLPSGIFFIKILGKDFCEYRKFIKL